MMKLDPDYVIPVLLSGLVGGTMSYFTSKKKAKDGFISGYVDGGQAFAKDLTDAVTKGQKVFMEEIEGCSNPEEDANCIPVNERIHDRILNECFGKNDTLRCFYQEVSQEINDEDEL